MNLKGEVRVVQVDNFHGSSGGSGAPIIYSQGKEVDVILFTLKDFNFVIHFTTVKQFCEQLNTSSLVSKKKGQEDVSRIPNMKCS